MSKEIPVVFYDGSNYDYHFVIKELAKESEGKFECLGKIQKSKKTFAVPIEKEFRRIDKDGNESVVTTSYEIKFIDSAGFVANLLSSLLDNFTEGIHEIKCKDCDCSLEYESVKKNSIKYKCLSCKKNHLNKIDVELKKRFKNTFKSSNNYINNFSLLLRKGVYRYEWKWMNWKSLTKHYFLEKKNFIVT